MLLLTLAAATLGPARLPPVDQCTADPSFVEFRSDLRRTIRRRDAKGLLAVVADDVHASLGGHVGKRDFIELWSLNQRSESKVWAELDKALLLGCSMRGGVPTIPSLGDQLDPGRDPFETLVALPGAVLRRAPRDTSGAVTRLQWDVLTISKPWDGGAWVAVRLDNGRRGFVLWARTRSPIDYRAWFQKRGGRWLIAGFLAGD